MSKYTKIFTTPYVPKYGPVPLSEVGQMMKERKQVIDSSMLQDERTMAMIDVVSTGLDESERNALLTTIEPFYKDSKQRIESGNYNIRDIDFQTRRDATRIAGLVEGFQGLKQQKQDDLNNFYKLNKDVNPVLVESFLEERGSPRIVLDEKTGYPKLSHTLGGINLSELEGLGTMMEQPDYRVLEPISTQSLIEEASFDIDPWKSPTIGAPYSQFGSMPRFSETEKEKTAETARSENKLVGIIEESIREENPDMSDDDLIYETKKAYKNYIEKTSQIESAPYRVYTAEEVRDARKLYIDDNTIDSREFFIPETGERLNIKQMFEKYGDELGVDSIADFKKEISLEGDVEDITGLYTLSGKGIAGSVGGLNFVMDTEFVDQLTMENREKVSKISNPYNFEPVFLTRRGTGNDSDKIFDLEITKDVDFYLGDQKVSSNQRDATPRISYVVTSSNGETYRYNTLNQLYTNVINPPQRR